MGFGRARRGLVLCHDPRVPADVLDLLAAGTYVTWEGSQ